MMKHTLTALLTSLLLIIAAPLKAAPPTIQNGIQPTGHSLLSIHYINGFSDNRDALEFEDGSKWEIDPEDIETTQSWEVGTPLSICPNYKMLSPYNYKIKNVITGAIIRVNATTTPVKFGPYSHWIMQIDPGKRELVLENNTLWKLSSIDSSVFSSWRTTDPIVIGVSNSCCSPYDMILINVNSNNYVYAKRLSAE